VVAARLARVQLSAADSHDLRMRSASVGEAADADASNRDMAAIWWLSRVMNQF